MGEILKQIASGLVPSVLAFLSAKLPILPFLNPQIPDDLWPITAMIAFASGALSYAFARPAATGGRTSIFGSILGVSGLLLAIASLVWMILVTEQIILTQAGDFQNASSRIAFVLCFAGLGFPCGWAIGRTLA